MTELVERLRNAPAVGSVPPYRNVAGCLYIKAADALAAAAEIERLTARVAAIVEECTNAADQAIHDSDDYCPMRVEILAAIRALSSKGVD